MSKAEGKFPKSFDTYQEVKPGEFVFCMFDNEETPRAVGLSKIHGMITGAYDVMALIVPDVAREFLNYVLLCIDDGKLLKPLYKGLRKTIPIESFMSYSIALPPLPEQKRIAKYLDKATGRIDGLREKITKEIVRLGEYKKSLIAEAVCGRVGSPREMKPSGIPWVGDIPKDWEVSPLYKYMAQVKNLNTGMRERNLLSLSYGKIKRKNIETVTGLIPTSYEGYNIIEEGDIVLRLTDLQNDKRSIRVGRATERGIVTSAYVTIRPSKECLSEYLAYAILVFDIKKGFYGIGSGVRQGLSYDEIKKLKFLFPPLPEQKRIAKYLNKAAEKIDALVEKRKVQLEKLDALKKSIVCEYVTGKKEVAA